MKKEKKKFSHPTMTIHTPIESPCRDYKRYAVLKIIYSIIRPKNAKNTLKCQKFDFYEDRLSFPVYGEKINLGHFRPFLRRAVLKVQNFCQN